MVRAGSNPARHSRRAPDCLDSPRPMALHDEKVKQEFSKQAASVEDPTYSFADKRLIGWILAHVTPEPGERVLDVAGGTGHVARAFARTAAQAVVIDITREMLDT